MEGEDEAEGRPLTLAGLHVDPALVVVGHMAHDGEPEPGPSGVPAAPVVDAVEAFENSIEVAGGDPDAAVLYGEADVIALLGAPFGPAHAVVDAAQCRLLAFERGRSGRAGGRGRPRCL